MNTRLVAKLLPRSWRTVEMHARYEQERQADLEKGDFSPLCEAPSLEEFTHWRIVANKYPYDAVALKHDMLIPRRLTDGSDFTPDELAELSELKKTVLNERYSFMLEAFPRMKSIPGHFHIHLIIPKQVN